MILPLHFVHFLMMMMMPVGRDVVYCYFLLLLHAACGVVLHCSTTIDDDVAVDVLPALILMMI